MSGLDYLLVGLVVVLAAVVLAAWAISNRVHYRESVVINAPPERVYQAIQSQEDLMAWSAWPAATNSTCRLVGDDNQVGATIEFISNGKVAGSQTVTEIVPTERVSVRLTDPSPFGQQPVVTFHVRPDSASSTEVILEFRNTIRRPFHLLLHAIGVVRWVRSMHRNDLAGLKSFCESPNRLR